MESVAEDDLSLSVAHEISEDIWRSDDVNLEAESFQDLHLSEQVLNGLHRSGFHHPSKIQYRCIPLGRIGLDLIVQSKAGTGKTCVFAVIALEAVLMSPKTTQVLILCPTREIAVQNGEVLNAIGRDIPGLTVRTFIGGTKVKNDKESLKNCQIAVATPGRLKQLIECGLLKTNSIRLLVLDEADKLMDANFKQQIDEIFRLLPESKQMIAVSATYPQELSEFLSRYMKTPVFMRLSAENPSLLAIKQYFYVTSYDSVKHIAFEYKIKPLKYILERISFTQCIIFANYDTGGRSIYEILRQDGWPCEFIRGEQEQNERCRIMKKLKSLNCRVLVATDLISRGIDCINVDLIINLDVPLKPETYLHRIGRAGRFGQKGLAITLATKDVEEDSVKKIQEHYQMDIHRLPDLSQVSIWSTGEMQRGEADQTSLASHECQRINSETFLRALRASNSFKDHPSAGGGKRYMTFNEAKADYMKFKQGSQEDVRSKQLKFNASDLLKRTFLSNAEIELRNTIVPDF